MRRPSLWALVPALVLFASAPLARAEGNDLTGQRAPEIYVQEGIQGIATGSSLSAYRGQVVVLKFWFTRCPACRRSLPEFQALYQRYAPRGVQFLALAYDETSNVRSYLRSTGFTFPVAVDGGGVTATRYGVFTYPTTYVIGADGTVKAYDQLSGPLLERELEAARAGVAPGPGRRPLASFPRQSPARLEAPSPATPPGPATPVAALREHPPIPPSPVPPAPPAVAAPPPAPAVPAPAPAPVVVSPPTPPADRPQVPVVPDAVAVAPVAPPPLEVAPPAMAPPPASAAPIPAGGPAPLPQDPALSTGPLPADPAAPGASAPSAPSAPPPPASPRVDAGAVAPSSPASGGQPASRASLVIPPDPAELARASAAPPAVPPMAPPAAPEAPVVAAPPTAPAEQPPVTEPRVAPPPAAPPTPASPFSGAAALLKAGDFPAVMRLVQGYAESHPDAASWAPTDLAEARRLEELVRASYLERNALARAQWARGEVEPALAAARALEAEYRSTSLERSAAALRQWFEANHSTTSR